MKTVETLCKELGIKGLVNISETDTYICINGKYLYNKKTNKMFTM